MLERLRVDRKARQNSISYLYRKLSKNNLFLGDFCTYRENFGLAMLTKYGWKEGQGLGKEQQGMSTALEIKKIGKNAGIIIDKSAFKKKMTKTSQDPTPVVAIRVRSQLIE